MRAHEFITEDDYYPSNDDYSKSEEDLDAFVQAYVDEQLGAPHKHSIKQDMSVIIGVPQSKNRKPGKRWDYEGQKEEWQETAMDLIDELNRGEFGEYEIAHMSASYIELYKPNLNETTTAGGIASVASSMGSTLTRNASIYGTPKKKKKKIKEDTESNWFEFGSFGMSLPVDDADAESQIHSLGAAGYDPYIETALDSNNRDLFHNAALDLQMVMPSMENYLMAHVTDERIIQAFMSDVHDAFNFMKGGYKKHLAFVNGKWTYA